MMAPVRNGLHWLSKKKAIPYWTGERKNRRESLDDYVDVERLIED